MRKRSISRKRHHDERCRSESESSCFSSSLKSDHLANGISHNSRKRSRSGYKQTKNSDSYHQSKRRRRQTSHSSPRRNHDSNSDKFSNRRYERRDSFNSQSRKRSRFSNPRSRSNSNSSIAEQDSNGYLVMKVDAVLKRRYRIQKLLGEGTFGRVMQCKDMKTHSEDVAVKVIRAVSKYRDAAFLELKVLDLIKKNDPHGKKLVISSLDSFEYHGHISIVFPLLGPSVFDFLKSNHYCGYPMRHVVHMAYQICKAVNFLHSLKLTHTDLKPENILLVDGSFDLQYNETTKRKVKVLRDPSIRIIDLGSATFEDEHHTSIIATRHYRPLEVVLGLGWSYSCDVWSVGCILFELYTGITMFMTHDNLEHLAMMERVLGHLPARMTRRCRKQKYFDECGRLRWDSESKAGRYVRSELKPLRRYIVRQSDIRELDLFDLIEEMLTYIPRKRVTMEEALRHPLICKYDSRSNHSQSNRNSSASSDSDSNRNHDDVTDKGSSLYSSRR